MDNNIERQLLEVIKINLTGANVKAIENIIAENKKLNSDNADLKYHNKDAVNSIKELTTKVNELEDKVKHGKIILSREEVLIRNENDYKIKVANHEKNILQIKLDNAIQSKTDIYTLSEILFKNRNIHHMVSTSGNIPVLDINGYATQHPLNKDEVHSKVDDNNQLVNE